MTKRKVKRERKPRFRPMSQTARLAEMIQTVGQVSGNLTTLRQLEQEILRLRDQAETLREETDRHRRALLGYQAQERADSRQEAVRRMRVERVQPRDDLTFPAAELTARRDDTG